jgi:hypothetical protein
VEHSASEASFARQRAVINADLGAKGREAQVARTAEWSKLDLKQDWLDEVHMRATLVGAGLRISNSQEPATVCRIRQLLRRVGKVGLDSGALGHTVSGPLSVAGWLERNPRMPLWAAVALILETV